MKLRFFKILKHRLVRKNQSINGRLMHKKLVYFRHGQSNHTEFTITNASSNMNILQMVDHV